jgi:hypothetical protein
MRGERAQQTGTHAQKRRHLCHAQVCMCSGGKKCVCVARSFVYSCHRYFTRTHYTTLHITTNNCPPLHITPLYPAMERRRTCLISSR